LTETQDDRTVMSNTPPTARPGPSNRPPQAPSAAAGVSIDPIKLLHKYKFTLIASVFVGVVVGVVSHVAFSRLAPLYTSEIIFECSPSPEAVEVISVKRVDETEMDRFIGTQVATIKDTYILSKVVTDPRLVSLAPKWSESYMNGGNINIVNALKDFEDMVQAFSVPNTFLIRLSVTARDKNDAAGLVTMVKDAYLGDLNTQYSSDITSRRRAIEGSIQATNISIAELTGNKVRLVREERIDSIESDQSTASGQLRLINAELLGIQQTLEALIVIRANDDAQLQRDTGIEYDSTLRAQIEESLMMLTFKQEIKRLETALVALQATGIQPDHRQYKQNIAQIDAHNRKIEGAREELLREAFESRVQNTAMTIQQLQAQEAEFFAQKEVLEEKLTELTRIGEEISDYDRQIDARIALLGEQEKALSDLQAAAGLSSAQRVEVKVAATVPDLPTFPIIYIMVPAGMFIVVGLTVGVIVLFEMLDQRIQSASDIRMIPRTRSLGMLLDACEDPSAPKTICTAFADAPGSVFAEHIRQLRTNVSASIDRAGHHSMVVVGAMPQSGATSVITNLAQSFVANGTKTLIIDANIRRPGIHTALGLSAGPGLSDVLAGESSLESCVININDGLSVLQVGSSKNRNAEQLSSQKMKQLLQQAKENYDLVLIDVAPAIVAGDATILSNLADTSMLVVRAMSEKRGQVARMSRELNDSSAEFLGVLVNAVRSAAGGYMRKNILTSFNYRNADEPSGKTPKDTAA